MYLLLVIYSAFIIHFLKYQDFVCMDFQWKDRNLSDSIKMFSFVFQK